MIFEVAQYLLHRFSGGNPLPSPWVCYTSHRIATQSTSREDDSLCLGVPACSRPNRALSPFTWMVVWIVDCLLALIKFGIGMAKMAAI